MSITLARPAAATAVVLGVLALTACGGDDPSGGRTADDEISEATERLADAQEDSGVPEECEAAFPMAWGEPDLADAALPPGWPEPPAGAVLCAVSGGDGSVQTVDYAADQEAAAVLDHYEDALAGAEGYDVTREEPPGLGHEVVSGLAGDAGFQVDPRDGGFRLAFDAS
ncbi:hypothetical protein KVF89_20190 [Nocardioides carbamazepini]|uniref:hypothetical protein n=1 Tax=Nocardioides carbamazepini TaxID=2854259 RepID=UPI00214A42E3|nr:hypothetical protein [Nocardioides carbamazepini]MCR1784872.1 hypothetical protein [Nocardioides carbamazepini]